MATTGAEASRLPARLLPSELVVRPIVEGDQALIDSFLSNERLREMEESGFTESEGVTRRDVLPLVLEGIARGWFVELPGSGPLCIQIYMPFGVPGVWSGEVINGPLAGGVGRRGVGTASMAVVLDALFADPAVHRLMGFVAVTNEASLRMVDRLGFTREGVARQLIPSPTSPTGRLDAVVMGLLRSEWQGAAAVERSLRSA